MSQTKKRKLPAVLISIVFLIGSVILNIYQFSIRNKANTIQVIGIIDGDTLVLEGKVKIRLRHIDAPELEFCGGEDAKKTLENLVVGQKVRLEESIPDQYGRSMALVYLGKTLVNESLLSEGLVRYHHDTTTKTDGLKKIAAQAKENRLGLFGKCQSLTPPDPQKFIKGNIDKQSNEHKYYLPDCAQYKFTLIEKDTGEDWFTTEKEAKAAGYVKAETCD